jgi:hypothetical protein
MSVTSTRVVISAATCTIPLADELAECIHILYTCTCTCMFRMDVQPLSDYSTGLLVDQPAACSVRV